MLPVSHGHEGWFLALFLAQYLGGLVGLALLGWLHPAVSWLEAAKLVTVLIICATTNAILIVEGIPMVAERYLQRRYNEGEEAGRAEGVKEGRAEGVKEGRAEGEKEGRAEGVKEGRAEGVKEGRKSTQQLWEAWNRRRLEAETNNEPFNEPPPSL